MLLTKMAQLRRLKIQLCYFLQEKYAQETNLSDQIYFLIRILPK